MRRTAARLVRRILCACRPLALLGPTLGLAALVACLFRVLPAQPGARMTSSSDVVGRFARAASRADAAWLDVDDVSGYLVGNSTENLQFYRYGPARVALRLLVLTRDRPESLRLLLASLDEADYGSSAVALHVWIDALGPAAGAGPRAGPAAGPAARPGVDPESEPGAVLQVGPGAEPMQKSWKGHGAVTGARPGADSEAGVRAEPGATPIHHDKETTDAMSSGDAMRTNYEGRTNMTSSSRDDGRGTSGADTRTNGERVVKWMVDGETLKVAREFNFTKGAYSVHLQPGHVGVQGQWMNVWRPGRRSEVALILEDDMTVSVHFWAWLDAVHRAYGRRTDVGGYSVSHPEMEHAGGGPLEVPLNHTVFLYRAICTWGFSPHPASWRGFQDWFYTEAERNGSFMPLVPHILPTSWFLSERRADPPGRERALWEQWHLYYTHARALYTLLANPPSRLGLLAVNRHERGLHDGQRGLVGATRPLCDSSAACGVGVALPSDPVRKRRD